MVASWLCLLCGVCGSGKTTLAHRLVSNFDDDVSLESEERESRDEVWSVDYDGVMGEEHSVVNWRETRKTVKDFAQAFLEGEDLRGWNLGYGLGTSKGRLSYGTEPMRVLLLDDNHMYRSMRKFFATLAAKYDAYFSCVFLSTPPLEMCILRKGDLLTEIVVRDVYAKFEPPRNEVWERNSITVDPSANWSDLQTVFRRATTRSLSPSPIQKPPPLSHRCELSLRRAVSTVVKSNVHLAAIANRAKKTLQKDPNFTYNVSPIHNESGLDTYCLEHLLHAMQLPNGYNALRTDADDEEP